MLPEVETYVRAREAAYDQWNLDREAAYSLIPEENRYNATEEQRAARYSATNAARARYDAAINTAKDTLIAATSDKLLVWMMENTLNEYPDQTIAVAGQLPATLDQLETFAEDAGYCNVWTGFVQQALAAGAIEDTRSARTVFTAWLERASCCPPSGRDTAIDNFVAKLREEFAAEQQAQEVAVDGDAA